MRTALCGALLGLAALPGCDAGAAPSSVLCNTPLEVSVTMASSPQVTWSPHCQVEQVVVLEPIAPSVGQPQVHWAVEKRGAGGMGPPLRYGQTPLGATVLHTVEPLVAGHHYVVQLSMTANVGNSNLVGEAGFTQE